MQEQVNAVGKFQPLFRRESFPSVFIVACSHEKLFLRIMEGAVVQPVHVAGQQQLNAGFRIFSADRKVRLVVSFFLRLMQHS